MMTLRLRLPVLAGVCGTDPFRLMPVFLKELCEMQFSGVQNYPTVGLYPEGDGTRENLEASGMGFGLEVDMIRMAHELDMLTCPYVFNPDEARRMAEVGADLLVAHMGLTTSGTIGARVTMSLNQAVERTLRIHDADKAVNPDVIVICHGGPIAEPDDVRYVLKHTKGIDGFFGASRIERLPVERAITKQVKDFKSTQMR
ncbi:MAG: phosphoenolpyruvate hydrolase family protein [Dehalococcoidia bacterium]|nr:phosphoenolpyruvate hydrolase family protein [Dehalococcoidia bacterium]